MPDHLFHRKYRVQITLSKNKIFCSDPANMSKSKHKGNVCVLAISFNQPNKHPIVAFLSPVLSGCVTLVSHKYWAKHRSVW